METVKQRAIKAVWAATHRVARALGLAGGRGFGPAPADDIVAAELVRLLAPLDPRPAVAMDIGCGTGAIAARVASLTGALVVGVDYVRSVALAPGAGLHWVRADSLALPFAAETVDVLWCYSVLQYLPLDKVEKLLAEAARVVKPRGVMILGEMIRRRGYFNDHLRGLDANPLKKAALMVYLNFFYPYYHHPAAVLEPVYRRLGMRWRCLAQDPRLPYAAHTYHVVLEKEP
jgi:ubiquinone/menaquinone biosynthesis C-methylase UbiE